MQPRPQTLPDFLIVRDEAIKRQRTLTAQSPRSCDSHAEDKPCTYKKATITILRVKRPLPFFGHLTRREQCLFGEFLTRVHAILFLYKFISKISTFFRLSSPSAA